MTDHTTHQSSNEIPYGYCHCGCGQKTRIPETTSNRHGWVKGQPVRFISGHNKYHANMPQDLPNPSGLCMCGCGEPAPIARQTDSRAGWIKGEYLKYRTGHSTRQPLEVCFWAKVKPGNADQCWIWQGNFKAGGYGKLSFRGQYLAAHRISYEIHKGTIPDGMLVCHTCDTPACVNPNHLWVGTSFDNVHDMIRKGRDNFPKKK